MAALGELVSYPTEKGRLVGVALSGGYLLEDGTFVGYDRHDHAKDKMEDGRPDVRRATFSHDPKDIEDSMRELIPLLALMLRGILQDRTAYCNVINEWPKVESI